MSVTEAFVIVTIENSGVRPAQNLRVAWALLDEFGKEWSGEDAYITEATFPKGDRQIYFIDDSKGSWANPSMEMLAAPVENPIKITVFWQSSFIPWLVSSRKILINPKARIEGSKIKLPVTAPPVDQD
jgi:hypothetical protein